MAANQVDFKILPSDQFSVYSPQTRSDKVITYFTLLSKLRGDILSVGQDDDPNDIVSAFYSSVGGTQTLHLVKADGSEITASVTETTVGTVTSVNLTASTGISVSGGPITTSGSITVTNTAPDQVVVLTGAGTTSISGTYPSFTITSNDQFVGTVTSVGTSAPLTGGTITTTGTIGITQSGVSTDGYLSSTDWNTFNNKQSTLLFSGPLVNTSGTVSIPVATTSISGYLNNTDWTTFNGKQNALTLTTTGTTGAATLIGATLNIPNYADQFVGTVTSVNMSVPTGFAISGNPITTSGTLAVAFDTGYSLPTNASQTTWNTAYNDSITAFAYNTSTAVLTLTQQDAGTLTATVTLQPFTTSNLAEGTNLYYTDARARLALSAGTGISYDSATGIITNSAPDQTVVLTASTGISVTGTYPSFTIANTAPDQTVALTGAGTTTISGTYPSFTITSNDQYVGTVTSVGLTGGTGITISGGPITSSGSITVTNSAPDQTVVLTGGTGITTSGTYPSFTVTNSAPDQTVALSAGTGISISGTYPSFTITNTSAGGGTITGSGTANYVSKFTSGSAIGNSQIFDDGTNVGIGNTAPNQKLELSVGNGVTGGLRINYAAAFTTEGMDITYLNSGNTTTSFDSRYNSDSAVMQFRMKTAATAVNAMTILGNGNIGINQTAPVNSLTIQRNTSAGTVAAIPGVVFSNRNTTNSIFVHSGIFADTYRDVADPHYSGGIWFTRNPEISNLSSSSHIIFGTQTSVATGVLPSERMRINSNGNISIGTTVNSGARTNIYLTESGATPNAILRLENTGNQYLAKMIITDGFTNDAVIGYQGGGTAATQYLGFGVGVAITQMIINASGNVGIGTTAPASIIHVSSTGANAYSSTITKASNMKGIVNTLSNNGDDMVGIYFATGTDAAGAHWSGITGSRTLSSTNWGTQLNFYTHDENLSNINDSTQKMVIKGSGNVGIGTTNPLFKTTISADITKDGDLTPGTAQLSLEGITTPGKRMILGYDTNSNGFGFIKAGNYGVTWTTLSLQPDGGGVGIGATSTGSYKFYVAGGQFGTLLKGGDTGTGSDVVRMIKADDSIAMLVRGDGNVGIGTTAPGAKLDVVSGDSAVLTLQNTENNFGANQQRIDFYGKWYSGAPTSLICNGRIAAEHAFSDGYQRGNLKFYPLYDGTLIDAMTIRYDGNVGIGTAGPSSKLHVIGNATDNVGLALFENTSSGGIYYPAATFSNTNGNHSYGIVAGFKTGSASGSDRPSILFYSDLAAHSWSVGQVTSGWGDNDAFGIGYRASNDPNSFGSWPSNYFTILTSGNVGINNNSPSYRLDVSGDARITSGSLGVGVAPNATDGRIDASNDIVAFQTSDRRLKENITPITNALEKVKSLTGVMFDWKEETKSVHGYEGHDVGIIAQDVQSVLPEAVRTNDTGYLSVRYEKMIALLIEANKELATRVEELESKLK
jgi:hypothetical protein